MRTVVVPLIALLLAAGLAGCADDGAPTDDVMVVESGDVAEVASGKEATSGSGWIEGVVVDETITPIAGASVALPGMDQTRRTLKDGTFAFGNLVPGPYFITADAAGFEALEAEVMVPEGTATVRIVLTREPSEDPFTTTQKFSGFQDVVLDSFTGTSELTCNQCTWPLRLDAYPDYLVVESWRDQEAPNPTGVGEDMRFYGALYDDKGAPLFREYGPDPYVQHVKSGALAGKSVFRVEMYPMAGLGAEMNVDFEVLVTSFHNAAPSENWSSRGGA